MGKEIKKFKKMKKLLCLLAILMSMLSVDCFAQLPPEEIVKIKDFTRQREYERLKNYCQEFEIVRAQQFKFQNLKGVHINIKQKNPDILLTVNRDTFLYLNYTCFIMPTVNYIKAMGFNNTEENEHTLNIYLESINADMKYSTEGTAYFKSIDVTFQIEMTNRYGEVIFEQVVSSYVKAGMLFETLNEAYTQALEQINWHKIASFLKKSSEPKQLAKEEPRKEVEGYGNTALENTIVRWDVQSRPAGADVFWRVVSKTPSVKSTNNKYLQTTPYEATKSLDIRGLSYENSGDVRIILRCEKDGYYPQEKEFNVRMIIDQEEISAFFKLVKVE